MSLQLITYENDIDLNYVNSSKLIKIHVFNLVRSHLLDMRVSGMLQCFPSLIFSTHVAFLDENVELRMNQ